MNSTIIKFISSLLELFPPMDGYITALATCALAYFAARGVNSWKENEQFKRKLESYEHAYSTLESCVDALIDIRRVFGLRKTILSSDHMELFSSLMKDHEQKFNELQKAKSRMAMLDLKKEVNLISEVFAYKRGIKAACAALDLNNGDFNKTMGTIFDHVIIKMYEEQLFPKHSINRDVSEGLEDQVDKKIKQIATKFLALLHEQTLIHLK